MASVSIIIPAFNKSFLTRQCLDAIVSRPPAVDFEIIVVDNGSRDNTAAMLASFGSRIRPIINERNVFFARACNQAAEVARGDLLLFLNNDTIPRAGWLDALVDYRAKNPRAGLVAAKLLYPNNTIQHAGMAVCQDLNPRLFYVGFPSDHPAVCKSRRLSFVSGACNLIERDLFLRIGMFDPVFINGYEDLDLCMRVRDRGYEVHICGDSVLVHLESVSEGRFRFEDQNLRTFRERWIGRLKPDDLDIYIADGLIRVEYTANSIAMHVAPELGFALERGAELPVLRVLSRRADQVNALMRENVSLRAATSLSTTFAPAAL